VLLHYGLRTNGVSFLEQAGQLTVVILRYGFLLWRIPDVDLVDERDAQNPVDELREVATSCSFQDRRMKPKVLLHEITEIAISPKASEPQAAGREVFELLGGDATGGPPRRVAFEERSHPVQLLEIVDRVPADDGAPVWDELDQPFAIERLERLSHRCAADPEPACEVLFLETLARSKLTLEDRATDCRSCGRAAVQKLRIGQLGERHLTRD
jgi:hypothetical protein